MLTAYLLSRNVLHRRHELGAQETAAAGCSDAGSSGGGGGEGGRPEPLPAGLLEPGGAGEGLLSVEGSQPPLGEVLRVPLTVTPHDGKGLFHLHFGRRAPQPPAPSGLPPAAATGAAAESGSGDSSAATESSSGSSDGDGAASAAAWAEALGSLRSGGEGSRPEPQSAPPPAVPQLDVVMLVVGTRGDVQPFIALGRGLQAHGHRVRLASHAVYRDFVQRFGLEFYPLGGDPEVLSEYIVRNRSVVPKASELQLARRSSEQVKAVLQSCYSACTAPDPGDPAARPFTAQAIIANPPSYGHIHCAEKLGVPLHMVFTMPWTPTAAFSCPLTSVNLDAGSLNRLSWTVVFDFLWTGLAHMINSWRQHELGLQPIRTGNHGSTLVQAHKVPFTYCWSGAVVPKPADWPAFVDVSGYLFLDEGGLSGYEPPPELASFLAAGPPPVYVGFGSLVVDDPEGLTRKVVDAAQAAGVRLLLSKGWGGLGEGLGSPPEGVLLLGQPCPHDWLFPRCSAVVHHGGAGTTAAGLKAGRPTAIIPVFGDQHFWGAAVHRMGLGPAPIPIDELSAEALADALRDMQAPAMQAAAEAAAAQIGAEDGVAAAVACFHRHLPLRKMARGEPVRWDLAAPEVSNVFYEVGAGFVNVVRRPIKGANRSGVFGAVKGAARGILDLNYRPVKGLVLSTQALGHTLHRGNGSEGEEGEESGHN